MLQVRLALRDYLLTGDPRELEKMAQASNALSDRFREGQSRANSDMLRDVFARMALNERQWTDQFAAPMVLPQLVLSTGYQKRSADWASDFERCRPLQCL